MAKIGPSKVPGKKAGPNGSFPVGDPLHARMAISGATRSERAGNISPEQEAHIKSEARAELAKSGHPQSGIERAMGRHADRVHKATK